MAQQRRPFTGRTALVLVLIVLIFTVCVAVYVFLSRLLDGGAGGSGEVTSKTELQGKLAILLMVLLCATLAILVFALGAYLLIRVGRTVAQSPVGGKPTEYSDAWSQYRISDEQIAAAVGESAEEVGDDDDDEDDPPLDDPAGPGEKSD